MKFKISRTSKWGDDKPCEEAFMGKFQHWHERSCTEEYFNQRFSTREGLWRSKGSHHCVTKEGSIKRFEGYRDEWAIELTTLNDLVKFVKKYGTVVFGDDFIEIYDAYRE